MRGPMRLGYSAPSIQTASDRRCGRQNKTCKCDCRRHSLRQRLFGRCAASSPPRMHVEGIGRAYTIRQLVRRTALGHQRRIGWGAGQPFVLDEGVGRKRKAPTRRHHATQTLPVRRFPDVGDYIATAAGRRVGTDYNFANAGFLQLYALPARSKNA
jgi:hypothetical protein